MTVLIPARAGSVELKNKNLRKIKGRTLIQRAVDLGLNSKQRVIVTTNIVNPLPERYEQQVEIYHRPETLCTKTAEITDVIRDAINALNLKGAIVLLQPTSPLRSQKQLDEILKMYFSLKPTLCLSATQEDNVILKNYIKINENYEPISRVEYLFSNRQSLPKVFHPNGAFYVFDAEDFNQNGFNTKAVIILKWIKLQVWMSTTNPI